MAVTLRVKVSIEATESYTGDLGNPGKVHRIDKDVVFTSGNGSSQFNKVYSDISSATLTYDVSGTTVLDAQGTAIAMSKLGFLFAENRGTTSGDVLTLGGDANSPAVFGAKTDSLKLGPQGFALIINPVDGWTVTAGTGDIVAATHTTGTYDHSIIVAGRS